MTFPAYIELPGLRVHPHLLMETVAYAAGARLYFARLPRETPGGPDLESRLWILVGCVFGALLGSKLLAWAEAPLYYRSLPPGVLSALGGKTIVGGLLGGWAGVEVAKRCTGVAASTGDAFVLPLAVGIAIGRVGCFLTGLSDRTYGVATALPWGVDFGDGVARHPTQLYECAAVLLLGASVEAARRRAGPRWPAGRAFRVFIAGYLAFRVAVECIKPRELLLGPLSAIQLASAAGLLWCLVSLRPCPTGPISTPS